MAEVKTKKITNKEHNKQIFAEIKKLEVSIDGFKKMLKPVEPIKNATLAQCNAMARKVAKKA